MALRRSSVKLSNFGKSNVELKMIISQLKTVRESYVSYTKTQEKFMDDMTKWAFKDENRAIQDSVERFNDLYVLWFETQREFAEVMDDFRQSFKMILEGEQSVEAAKSDYEAVEHREHKLKKELKKLSKKVGNHPSPSQDVVNALRDLEHKLRQVSQDKELFKIEANDRIKEQEAVKMIRFKNAVSRLTIGHLDMAEKCDICFSAGQEIVDELPDVENKDIHRVRYLGTSNTLRATLKAKEKIKNFRSRGARKNGSHSPPHSPSAPQPVLTAHADDRAGCHQDNDELPPPYAEVQPSRNPNYVASSPNVSSDSRLINPHLLNTSSPFPASPGRYSETTTTATSSADSSYIR